MQYDSVDQFMKPTLNRIRQEQTANTYRTLLKKKEENLQPEPQNIDLNISSSKKLIDREVVTPTLNGAAVDESSNKLPIIRTNSQLD